MGMNIGGGDDGDVRDAGGRRAPAEVPPRPAEGSQIDLSIDELVLDGVSAADSGAVEHALRRELARLLVAAPPSRSLRARVGAVPRIDLPASAPRSPHGFGNHIARAIHGVLRKS